MKSSSSGCEGGRERSCGSKGPRRKGHRGSSRRGEGSSRRRDWSKEGKKPWKKFKKDKNEVNMAVAVMCQDMKPFHQAIVAQIIKDSLKGKRCRDKSPKEEYKRGRKHSKERKFHSAEKVKEVAKEVLKTKEKIIETTELIMGVLKEQRMPKMEETKSDGEEKFHHGHKRFAREVAAMILKMWKKGITDKEEQKKMAERFFEKMKKRRMKKMTKGTKRMVEKILFYDLESCDPVYRKVVESVVACGFATHCFLKMGEMKKGEKTEEQKEGEKGEFWHHRRGRGHFWKRFIRGDDREEKGHGFMLKKMLKFAMCYYKKNEENIKTCFEAVKGVVDEHFKEDKCCKKVCKTMSKIVSEALKEEEKTKEFYVDFAKKYIKGLVTPCHKGCEKKCQKFFKVAMLLDGVKDKCVIDMASHWGAIACCQANGKTGCPEDSCAEFSKKWLASNLPIVTEAVAIAKEMEKEFADCPTTCGKGGKLICELVLKYLAMNCTDGKLNKDDLKAYLKAHKERMNKKLECMKAECKDSK